MTILAAPVSFDAARYAVRLDTLRTAHDVPGCSLAVWSGDVTTRVASGVLNRRTGTPATTDSLFQIGSIGKVWTTALILTLVDEGRLALTDLVSRYVPELVLSQPEAVDALTVAHLLNHTSGLPGDWFPDTGRGDDCLARLVPLLADVPLTHPVGDLTSYSNTAFCLAGHVVERITGQTWDLALRHRVIDPLGLHRTVTLAEQALLHQAAVGHLGIGSEQAPAPVWQLPRACGPAGLVTASMDDIVEFGRVFVADSPQRLLSTAAAAAMTTLTAPLPSLTPTSLGFGLGWGITELHGQRLLAHDGGTIGQHAALRILPELGVIVALAANGGDWVSFRDAVLDDVLAATCGLSCPGPPEVGEGGPPLSAPEDYVGHYRTAGSMTEVRHVDGELTMQHNITEALVALVADESQPIVLVAAGRDSFLARLPRQPRGGTPAFFLRDTTGAVAYLHVGGQASRRFSPA